MSRGVPLKFTDPDQAADAVIEKVGPEIKLALPLGIGKANHLANALFDRVAADQSLRLKILTALTLEAPTPGSELERRFLEPIANATSPGTRHLATPKACVRITSQRISRSRSSFCSPAIG